MMLIIPQKFFGTLFHHFKHPKDQDSSMSKIDFLEKNDTFVRYCPSMDCTRFVAKQTCENYTYDAVV